MPYVEAPTITQRTVDAVVVAVHPTHDGPLQAPTLEQPAPLDLLSQLLLSIERQNQSSLQVNQQEIRAARDRMQDLQRQLAAELKRALEAAQHRRHKKHGWFSKTFGGAIDLVAKVFAKQVEAMKDVVVLHADVAVSLAKHFGDKDALLQSLKHDLMKLNESSETEKAVQGFTAGTARFMVDAMGFQLVLVTALASAEAQNESMKEALKQQSTQLWNSLEANILENPDFWTVTARVGQAAAVAGAFASGGTLAPAAAVVLMLALEADRRYGFIEEVAGQKAAPWVRLGMEAGATICLGFGSHSSELLKWVQVSTTVLQGTGQVHHGVKAWQEGNRRSEELHRQADVQETLHYIRATQRLIDTLIDLYEDRSDHRERTADSSVRLVETQAATESALVFQG